jgi:hypothetical protein
VNRLSHRPGAQQRALLGAGAVDLGGGQPAAARPKRQPRRKAILRLRPGDRPGDLDRIACGRGPVKELRRGSAPG